MSAVEKTVIAGPVLAIVVSILVILTLSLAGPGDWTKAQAGKNGSSSTNTSTSTTTSSGNGNGNGGGGGNGNGNGSSSSSSSTTSSSSSSSSSGGASQTGDTSNEGNALVVDFDGNPGSISGKDHDLDGDESNSGATVPAIGIPHYDAGYLEGEGAGNVWVMAQTSNNGGHAGDDKTEGGISNNLANRENSIDQLIQAFKMNANYTLDTSGNTKPGHFGTAANPVIVYAAPSEKDKERPIHFSGQGTSYGVLVIEVNDPKMGGIIMNAHYEWQGLVIIVMNYRDTNRNSSPIDMNGSGNQGNGHIVGGALVYHRNQAPSASDKGELLGDTMADLGGGGRINYSSDALRRIKVPSFFQVKSWRKTVD